MQAQTETDTPVAKRKGAKGATRCATVAVTTRGGRQFNLSGLTSPRGDRWVEVRCRGSRAFVRYSDFAGPGTDALRGLASREVVIVGPEWPPVRDAVAKLEVFPRKPLIEQPGWSGQHFALPDGRVYSPPGSAQPIVLFRRDNLKCATAGSGKEWKRRVCRPLAKQPLCAFMMMTVFAPVLLRLSDRFDNFGFELVGDAGIGKSTLQQLIATAAGGGLPSAPGRYWVDCNTTANALEATMVAHSDQLIIMEEAALFAAGASNRARASEMTQLIFKLAAGTSKARYGAAAQTEHRLIYVMSSNMSQAEVLAGGNAGETRAAADRLITLSLDDRQYGIFDFVPPEYSSASDFASALKRAAAEHYGHAFPCFVRKLVKLRARDSEKLRSRIRKRLNEFRTAVAANPDDGSDLRVADAFGLSYAAGRLAKRFKILPASFDCLGAAVACYNLHREGSWWGLRLPHRLKWIANQEGVVDLDKRQPKLTDIELFAVPAFVRTAQSGNREILFTRVGRDRFFRDFDDLKRDPANWRWFKSERGRDTVRRCIRKGRGKEPVYRFFLPPDDPDEDDDDNAELV